MSKLSRRQRETEEARRSCVLCLRFIDDEQIRTGLAPFVMGGDGNPHRVCEWCAWEEAAYLEFVNVSPVDYP